MNEIEFLMSGLSKTVACGHHAWLVLVTVCCTPFPVWLHGRLGRKIEEETQYYVFMLKAPLAVYLNKHSLLYALHKSTDQLLFKGQISPPTLNPRHSEELSTHNYEDNCPEEWVGGQLASYDTHYGLDLI